MICPVCGEPLSKEGDLYRCKYCAHVFEATHHDEAIDALARVFEADKIERLANARRLLYDATHHERKIVEFPVQEAVVNAARAVLSIRQEEPFASIVLHSYDADPFVLVQTLSSLSVDAQLAEDIFSWLLMMLNPRLLGPLNDFVCRHFKDKERTQRLVALEEEAAKIDDGTYVHTLARDVFLAYSSSDMAEVLKIIDLLEENGLTVFAAFRNMRHGKGAAENYLNLLKEAMGACKTFVFLSSNSSRQMTCDAMKVELPYLISNLPGKKRVEYILHDYPARLPLMVRSTLKDAFPEQEQCRDAEELVSRIYGLLKQEDEAEKKRFDGERLQSEKETASEKEELERLRKELEQAKRNDEAKKRQEIEAKERALEEERAKQAAKDRELEEKKLEIERQRLAIEKAKLSSQESGGSFAGNLDEEAFLAMMEKAQRLKKEKEEADRRRQIEEDAKRREQQRQEEERRREEAKRQEDIRKRSFRIEKDVPYYGNCPWVPIDFDSKKKQMLVCCKHSVGEAPSGTEAEDFLLGRFAEAFPDKGAKFARPPFLQTKEEMERLAYSLPRLGFAVWTGSKEKGSWIARKADGTFALLDEKESVFVWPFAVLDLNSLSEGEASAIIEQYRVNAERAGNEKAASEKKALEEQLRKKRQLLKEALIQARLERAIAEQSLTKPVFSWKDQAVWYGIYPQVLIKDPPSPDEGERVGEYQKIGLDYYYWKGKQCFQALPIKWIIVGKAHGSLVLRAEKILDEQKYDRRSERIANDYRLSGFCKHFLNRDFLSLAFPCGHRHVYAEKDGSRISRQVFLPAAQFLGLASGGGASKCRHLKNTDFSRSDIILVTDGDLYDDSGHVDAVKCGESVSDEGIFGKVFGIVPCIIFDRNKILAEEDPDFVIDDPKTAKKAETELRKLEEWRKARKEENDKKHIEARVNAEVARREKEKENEPPKAKPEATKSSHPEPAAEIDVYEAGSPTLFVSDIAKAKAPVRKVIVPASVTRIEFYHLVDDLREAYGHRTLETIESIEVDPENPTYYSENGYLIRRKDHCLLWCPPAMKGNLKIPAQVERIDTHAFGVIRPDAVSLDLNNGTLKSIASGAICCGKCQVFVPATVTSIERDAFSPYETTTLFFETKKPFIGFPSGYDKKMLGTDHKPVIKWGVPHSAFLASIKK